METAATVLRCPHCNTNVNDREVLDGWCDSCGKKLPLSYKSEVKAKRPTGAAKVDNYDEAKPGGNWRLVASLVAAAVVVLTVAGLTLLSMI